jgi:hypothetical protein
VERYQNKFATTSAMMRECQMQVSGPWPPYHFVHRLTRALMRNRQTLFRRESTNDLRRSFEAWSIFFQKPTK